MNTNCYNSPYMLWIIWWGEFDCLIDYKSIRKQILYSMAWGGPEIWLAYQLKVNKKTDPGGVFVLLVHGTNAMRSSRPFGQHLFWLIHRTKRKNLQLFLPSQIWNINVGPFRHLSGKLLAKRLPRNKPWNNTATLSYSWGCRRRRSSYNLPVNKIFFSLLTEILGLGCSRFRLLI